MGQWRWRDLGVRPLVFPAVGLAAGVELGSRTASAPALFPALALGLALAALAFRHRPGAHLAVLAALVLGGASLASLEARARIPEELAEGGPAVLEGRLEEVEATPEGVRLTLAVARVWGATHPEAAFRARLWARPLTEAPWAPGQRVVLKASLKPLEPPLNWGEWDGTTALRRRRVLFGGSADGRTVVPLSPPGVLARWLTRAREGLGRAAHAKSPTPEAAALYATLAAGLRAELGPAWEQRFAQSGLAHVLSVSGLHVAALALLCHGLARALLVRLLPPSASLDPRRLAALASVPALWGYVAFTGNQAAAVRSAVMASAFFGALALWRRADALNSLSFAACVLLVVDPSATEDLSLQLSFAAVASLILLSPPLRALMPAVPPGGGHLARLSGALADATSAGVAVTLGGAGLVAGAFHRLSLVGLLSNLVCMPLCAALTGLSAGGAAAYVVAPPLAAPFLWAGTRGAWLLLWAVERFARLPGAAIPVAGLGPVTGALFGVGLASLAFARGRARALALLAPLVLVWLALPARVSPGRMTVTFLAVGQGDSTLVESGGQALLVDGGGVPGGADPGERVVVPYLRERRIHRLALAALSHPHPDHALGLTSALSAVPTERLWLPEGNEDGPLTRGLILAAGSAAVERVREGHPPFALGAAQVEVLGPPRDALLLRGVNDRSLVLRVRHGDVTLLLPGDVEAAGEEALFPGATTILKAPHHGSSTSSTPSFLARARPRFVVFCVGRRNRFHFPHGPVVERYRALGTGCYRTDLQGAVRFTSDGHDVRVETFVPPGGPGREGAVGGGREDGQLTRDDSGRPGPGAIDRVPQVGAQAG